MGLKKLFSQKLTKIAQRLGALPPESHSLWRLELRSQTPVCDTFEYTSLLNTSPKLDLHILTITFRRFP